MKAKLVLVDKYGWPVEHIRGKPITNFIRRLLHGRRRTWWLELDDGGLRPMETPHPRNRDQPA